MASYLFIESVQKLLPRSCARESRPVIQRPAESPVVQQSFRRSVEHHAHAVQQIDDARRGLAHALDQRLVRQKIAAVNRVIQVFVDGVALALLIFRRVDAALRANGMRSLHRHDGKKIHRYSRLSDADGGH